MWVMLYGSLELFLIQFLKNHLNCLKYNIFCFHKFFKKNCDYIRTKHPSYKIVLNYTKNHLNCFKYNIFCSQIFSKHFHEYIRTKNPSHKIAWNYLKISWIVFINFLKKICEYIRTGNSSRKIAWNYSKNHLSCFKYNIF